MASRFALMEAWVDFFTINTVTGKKQEFHGRETEAVWVLVACAVTQAQPCTLGASQPGCGPIPVKIISAASTYT